MLNTVNSGPPTFASFLRNVTSRVHYLGFSANKRGLDTLPNPGNRRETQLSHPNSRWCPRQNSCCRLRERVRDPPWSQDWLWDPALHSPSLGFLTQILVIIICHKTQSHFRGLKGKTKRRVQPPQISPLDGTLSHLIPSLSVRCTWLWDAVFYRSLPSKTPGEGPRQWTPETADFWGSCQPNIWHAIQYIGEII